MLDLPELPFVTGQRDSGQRSRRANRAAARPPNTNIGSPSRADGKGDEIAARWAGGGQGVPRPYRTPVDPPVRAPNGRAYNNTAHLSERPGTNNPVLLKQPKLRLVTANVQQQILNFLPPHSSHVNEPLGNGAYRIPNFRCHDPLFYVCLQPGEATRVILFK